MPYIPNKEGSSFLNLGNSSLMGLGKLINVASLAVGSCKLST